MKRPFAVRFKHPWSSGPIWETFWTQTAETAIAQARTLYSDISGKTEAQIIKKKEPPHPRRLPLRPVGHYLKQSLRPIIGLNPF